jgi:DNA-binding NarL/FixJ family response regulator
MRNIRILIAEDHKIVRQALTMLLNSQSHMEVVGEAGDGQAVLQQAEEHLPDIVVMDLTMPGINGLQATKALKVAVPSVKVIVLTAHEDESYLYQLCKAGAAGYVLKQSGISELIRALNEVSVGRMHYDAALAAKALALRSRRLRRGFTTITKELSERESEVLRAMAWGYTNHEVADRLNMSVKTVETYKARGGGKLGLKSRSEMVQFAVRQGWMKETHPWAAVGAVSPI